MLLCQEVGHLENEKDGYDMALGQDQVKDFI